MLKCKLCGYSPKSLGDAECHTLWHKAQEEAPPQNESATFTSCSYGEKKLPTNPSPQDALLDLLQKLHTRIYRLETALRESQEEADRLRRLLKRSETAAIPFRPISR